jgi:hypothetical protein
MSFEEQESQASERHGVTYESSVTDVSRKKDL